ncbi:uncharacterized protein SAZU_5153 [Streptomyces azureus]|uniref:Uncharacterized protein n=1 Tax=Streptomyces azureus TaxID=146537 RepID=A0A0K8PR05_STRAJ|nr:uncharacterized protein SAZU_5153 [Streptomyces azureus]
MDVLGSEVLGSGVGGDNFGNAATTRQQAVGEGASSRSSTAQVSGSAFTAVNQGYASTAVSFAPLWWWAERSDPPASVRVLCGCVLRGVTSAFAAALRYRREGVFGGCGALTEPRI